MSSTKHNEFAYLAQQSTPIKNKKFEVYGNMTLGELIQNLQIIQAEVGDNERTWVANDTGGVECLRIIEYDPKLGVVIANFKY